MNKIWKWSKDGQDSDGEKKLEKMPKNIWEWSIKVKLLTTLNGKLSPMLSKVNWWQKPNKSKKEVSLNSLKDLVLDLKIINIELMIVFMKLHDF